MYLTFNFKEIQTMHISVRFCKSWKGFWQAHEGCNWITNSTHRIYIWHWNTHAQKMKKFRRNELYEKCCSCFGYILSFVSWLWQPHHKTLKTYSPPHRWGTWETAVSNNNNSSLFCIGVLTSYIWLYSAQSTVNSLERRKRPAASSKLLDLFDTFINLTRA